VGASTVDEQQIHFGAIGDVSMIGQVISRYKILEELCEEGMSVVYNAQDTTHDRVVILKYLPHHLTSNEAGRQFLVMESIDGASLREKLSIEICSDAVASAIQFGEVLKFGNLSPDGHTLYYARPTTEPDIGEAKLK
jgi:serine/threonine protein kinase